MTNVPVSNNMLMGLPTLTQSNTLPTVTPDSISASSDQRGTFIYLSPSKYSVKRHVVHIEYKML